MEIVTSDNHRKLLYC